MNVIEMTRLKNKPPCELHVCLRQPMRLCRWVGMFPVEGLDKKGGCELRCNMKSGYIIYHCSAMLGQILMTCWGGFNFFSYDLSLVHLTNFVFSLTNLISAIFLLKLARNWPTLIRRASCIELRVACINCEKFSSEKYTRVTYIVLFLALLEHILSVTFKMRLVMNCNQHNTVTFEIVEQYFVVTTFGILNIVSYSHWKAAIYEVVTIQSTFLWNFTDVLTMCASLYLTKYFKDLNKLIEYRESRNIIRWEEIRLYYSDLKRLVQIVDSKMCYLILLSFFTNMFFICVQLFSLLNRNYPEFVGCQPEYVKLSYTSAEYYIYYSYSVLFLFIRATVTSLLAANLNTVAQAPFFVMQHVPTSEYTIEVQRFLRQTQYTTTALSGVFFDVTREMILTVIATIVKYEMVMLQLSVKTHEATH